MRGWSVLGSVPLMGSGVFGWSLLMARWIYPKLSLTYRQSKTRQGTAWLGRVEEGSETRGVLLVPTSSPTLPPIYDDLDVSVASNITWFHLNHDMVSRRI